MSENSTSSSPPSTIFFLLSTSREKISTAFHSGVAARQNLTIGRRCTGPAAIGSHGHGVGLARALCFPERFFMRPFMHLFTAMLRGPRWMRRSRITLARNAMYEAQHGGET